MSSEDEKISYDRFKSKLAEQVSFLVSSCERYDQGHTAEALRISLSLRIIFYSNKGSTSILKHMGITNLNLLSTGGISKEEAKNCAYYFGMGRLRVSSLGDSGFQPHLEDGPQYRYKYLPLSDWWQECVYVLEHGKPITRFAIMIAAANNDGGAHVDASLEPLYASLAEQGSLGSFGTMDDDDNFTKVEPISRAHHVALRQIAYEVLNSPEFMKLIE